VLADLPDASFAAPERARLDDLRLAALEDCLDSEVALGHAAEAAAEAAELLEQHPYRERLWALLMTALASSGRQVDSLRAFERYRRLLAEELGLEPSSHLRALERSILGGSPSRPRPDAGGPAAGNLPATVTSFVGRAGELAGIHAALERNRLVTLTGPAGVGKTRLAIEAAARRRVGLAAGAWFVDLAVRTDADGVAQATAAALGIDEQSGEPLLDTVLAALGQRGELLLVVDNCEHLLEASAAFADAILARCPAVRVLATTRHPLDVGAEELWPVLGLGEEAIELFADRARRVAPGFELTPGNRAAIAELCHRLDGLPLAIELAASQVRVLEPSEIVDRLDDRFRLLVRAHGTPPRHRTLRATVAWTHDLLGPATRTVLARVGVFPGSFTLEAAEAVCSGGGIARRDVLGHITELVDHSLLVRDPGPANVARYRLLETIRLFAGEQLDASGEDSRTRAAHAGFCLQLATMAEPHFYGPDEALWRERLRADDHNLDAALRWSTTADPAMAARLAVALWWYWDATWRESAAVDYVAPILSADVALPADLRAWALVVAAALGGQQGDARRPMAWAEQALEAFTALGDEIGLAWARHMLGQVLTNQGSLDPAVEALEGALDVFRRYEDNRGIGLTLHLLGVTGLRRGDYAAAERWHLEELALWRRMGSRFGQGGALRRLAVGQLHLGNLAAAAEACCEARSLFTHLDDKTAIAHALSTEADIAREHGDHASAAALYEQAMDGFRVIGDRRCTASTHKNLAILAVGRGEHRAGAVSFRHALALRDELGDDAGLAECLEGLAGCELARDNAARAAELLGMARAVRQTTGAARDPAERAYVDGLEQSARAEVGDKAYDAAVVAASNLAPATVASRALNPSAEPDRSSSLASPA
jgi:predicted ATPase